MVVPVVLIGAAKLEQVVAFQCGNIIAQHLVVPVPETVAGLLRVYVVRSQVLGCSIGLAAENLERPAESA
jgi:hypothetical protein